MKKTSTKPTVIRRTERILLPPDVDFSPHCRAWTEAYNCALAIQTARLVSTQNILTDKELRVELKKDLAYQWWCDTIGKTSVSETMQKVYHGFKAYFGAIEAFRNNKSKFKARPNPPKSKDNLGTIYLNGRQLKTGPSHYKKYDLPPGLLRLTEPYGYLTVRLHKAFGKKVVTAHIKPVGNRFELLVHYELPKPQPVSPNGRIAAIDLGSINAVTMVDNLGSLPVIIRGAKVNAINRWYVRSQRHLNQGLSIERRKKTKAFSVLSERRKRRVRSEIHNIASKTISWCVARNIDTIIYGLNRNWKYKVKMRRKPKYKFVYFPFALLIKAIEDKAELFGIQVISTEESYTSKHSFLDDEALRKLPDHQRARGKYLARRIYRGLYRSSDGTMPVPWRPIIHGDVNAAYNIGKKVFPHIFNVNKIKVYLTPVSL